MSYVLIKWARCLWFFRQHIRSFPFLLAWEVEKKNRTPCLTSALCFFHSPSQSPPMLHVFLALWIACKTVGLYSLSLLLPVHSRKGSLPEANSSSPTCHHPGQIAPTLVLSALKGKRKRFLVGEAATSSLSHESTARFFIAFHINFVVSHFQLQCTACSAVASSLRTIMRLVHQQTFNGCRLTVSCSIHTNKKVCLDQGQIFPTTSLFWELIEEWCCSAHSKLPITGDRYWIGRPVKG